MNGPRIPGAARRRPHTIVLASLLLALSLGCGEEGPEPVSQPASATGEAPEKVQAAPERPNGAPEIRSLRFEPAQPAPDEPLRVIADTFDPDGDPVTLSYRWFYQGREVAGDSDLVTFQNSKKRDWIEVRVTPGDGRLQGQPVKAETRVANRAPSAISLRMEPSGRLQAGTPIVARADSRDFDGDPVRYEYRWSVNGVRQPEPGNTFRTAGLARGDRVEVQVVASDGEAVSPPVTSRVFEIENAPPEIVSQPTGLDSKGRFIYQVEVRDPDDRRFSYRLRRAPAGMDIDLVSGRVYWKPPSGLRGSHPVEILVEDRSGGRSYQSFELTLHPPSAGPASR
jgi:hypothetical protein